MNISTRLPLLSCALLAFSGSLNGSEVFVSPSGRDTNPGTTGKPLKTIAAAVDAVCGKDGATVWLKGTELGSAFPYQPDV